MRWKLFYLHAASLIVLGISCGSAQADDLSDLLRIERHFDQYSAAYRYQEAEAAGRQMLQIAEQLSPARPDVTAIVLNKLGMLYKKQSRYADAEKSCLRSLQIKEKIHGRDHAEVAAVMSDLATVYIEQARYAEAEPLLREAVVIEEKHLGRTHPDLAITLLNLGKLCDEVARYDEAETLNRRTLAIQEAAFGANHPNVADTLNNLALVYNKKGRYGEAETLFRRALAIRRRAAGRDTPESARLLNNLAILLSAQGRAAEAEPLLRQSLAIKEAFLRPDHPEVALTVNNLAVVYSKLGRYAESETLHRRALAARKKAFGDKHPEVAVSLNNLAGIYKDQGRYAEADPLYQQMLAVTESVFGKDHPEVARAITGLARSYHNQNRYEEAEKLLDRGLLILGDGSQDPRLYYATLGARAEARYQQGKTEQAIGDLRHAISLAETVRGQFAGAEQERSKAFSHYLTPYRLMIDWQTKLQQFDEAFAASEQMRARSLVDQMQVQGVDLFAGMPKEKAAELRNREQDNLARIAMLEKQSKLTKDPEMQKRLEALLAQARAEAAAIYRDIRTASPAWQMMVGKDFKPTPLEEVQAWVKGQDGLLLEYVIGEDDSLVFVIRGDAAPIVEKLEVSEDAARILGVKPGPLTDRILRSALALEGKPLAEVFKSPASQGEKQTAQLNDRLALLWKLLVPAEVREQLTSGEAKRLIVVPDAALVNLPFDALVVDRKEGDTKYLLDVGPPILSGPSATLLYNLSTQQEKSLSQSDQLVLSVGDPIYGQAALPTSGSATDALTTRSRFASLRGELKPLPYTGWEAEWVSENFNPVGMATRKLVKAEATEQAVRANLVGRKIVHLACHGLCDQTYGNLFGALAFTPGRTGAQNPADDGFLTLAEIYGLNLQGCELAILSACETNLGPQQQGEGVFALSRGFLVAGSRRVVASNWIVDDESSASLVSAFCSALAKQHKSGQTLDYAEALHQAKRWVRKQEKWNHPYHWGAFVLVGPK